MRVPLRAMALVVATSAVAIPACDEDDPIIARPIVRIELAIGDCTRLTVNDTCSLEAIAITADGSVDETARLFWSSLNITIATVDFEGVVTGRGVGTATIRVQSAPGGNACDLGAICSQTIVSVDQQPQDDDDGIPQ